MRPFKFFGLATTGLSLALLSSTSHAQTPTSQNIGVAPIEDTIFVHGQRRAYQGNFDFLEDTTTI